MSEIIRFHCPQCGARHAEFAGPVPISVMCTKCHIPMVASPPSMDDCKYRHEDHNSPPVAYCARGVSQAGCRYCKQNYKEVSQMKEQWEEIRIEDVQPGDVARCNGREFPVIGPFPHGWEVQIGQRSFTDRWVMYEGLGFTFHRRVKREPRTFDTNVEVIDGCHYAQVPTAWTNGTRVRITELLDGEDGA